MSDDVKDGLRVYVVVGLSRLWMSYADAISTMGVENEVDF